MKRVKKKIAIFLIGLICTIIFTSISQYIQISSPKTYITSAKTAQIQYDDESLTAHLNCSIFEYSEDLGIKKNVSSIDINLETSRWKITDIELNITDISFKKEIKTVIDVPFPPNSFSIEKTFPLLGVQFHIEDPTILYGVDIYGYNDSLQPTAIYFQIFGSNELGAPDESKKYGVPILLNMSTPGDIRWHRQTFKSSISLSAGYYYLIINGTSIGLSPPTQKNYYWYYKSNDPENPTLNTSRYHTTDGWSSDYRYEGSPLTYKLIQKINTTFYPNEINMTAKIDGFDHPINNGTDIGTGNLSLSFNNFYPNSDTLNIPIKNNKSNAIIFNWSYNINLNNSFLCNSKVKIRENLENKWTLNFNLDRFGFNYSVKFDYPTSWSNFEIYRNGFKLTSIGNYSDNGNILEIFNKTISDPSIPWEIRANSTNLQVDLNAPVEWSAGQLLQFSLKSPIKAGNYSYILYDKNGFKKKYEFYMNPDASIIVFNYSISLYDVNGDWKAFIYWNNGTDAGVKTQIFKISGGTILAGPTIPIGDDDNNGNNGEVSEDITPIIILAIVLIGGITSAVSISSYEGFKRLKRIRDQYRNKLLNQFKDLMNLNYIMITEKKSGLNIFEQYIAGQEIDATLISGFLNAIRAFGIELTKSNDQSQTISLEYKDSKVLMSEFKNFRIIVIMKERPSEQMINSITDLSYSIEKKYSEILGQFKGNIVQFAGISDLIEEHLHTSFISPLKVVEQIDVKLSIGERAIINKAKELMKEYNLNYFHSTYLISEQKFKPSDVENILNLINKKIFQPTSLGSAGIKKIN